MNRFRNAKVGQRLTAAFALVGLLLAVVIGVGLSGASRQHKAQEAIVENAEAVSDVLHLKFRAADFNGRQTAYAFEAVLKATDATLDTGTARKAFLDSAAAFRSEMSRVKGHRLAGARQEEIRTIETSFARSMALDEQIIALYRTGNPASADKATALVLGEQPVLFNRIAEATDRMARIVGQDSLRSQKEADDSSSLTRTLMLAVGGLALGLAAVLAVVITRSMTIPLRRTSSSLTSSSSELSAVSQQMSAAAEETAAQAATVSAAAEQVSNSLQSVSAGAEELGSSIQEIARNTGDAATVASKAVSVAEATNGTVLKLGASSTEIGAVIKVITSIAEQTNLLALNATIEAARAGEAGKGFAVVATEVKDLARKTARSSDEIGRKIESIQSDAQGAVTAIAEITAIIVQINDIQAVIAASVEEQAATASEIGRSVTEAAAGSSEIARNITGVAEAARDTTEGAAEAQRSAEELSRLAGELLGLVGQFRSGERAMVAPPSPPRTRGNGTNGGAPNRNGSAGRGDPFPGLIDAGTKPS